ncbi:MAG: flagellin lysine-N-methylase [Oscillospiraceae bacterium]|nr:flagellin lysine-N-methylase [Oscillospiraceae bacterium]
MILRKPPYFDTFTCIAGACPDSCCKEWAVQVDDASAEFYRNLPGPLGDRLRRVLTEEDGDTVMAIENGRCPMWRSDGLCRIQAELGEEALCATCRDFPRLRHDYGDFMELGLELSCPEAARLILSAPYAPRVCVEIPGGEEPEYDQEAMDILLSSRETVLSILSDPTYTVPQALALGLLYGYQVQSQLDSGEEQSFDAASALDSVRGFLKAPDHRALPDFFAGLEILTEAWRQRLARPTSGAWTEEYRALAQYFVERYWLQAVSDYDLYSRIKFITASCVLIHLLGGNMAETAQLYSKEIENNLDNVEAILDAAYTHPAFTDEKLLGLLLTVSGT